MLVSQRTSTQRLLTGLGTLFLIALLAACSSSGNTPASTPGPSGLATPSPTPGFQTYTGMGYTIGYPSGWKVQSTRGAVTLIDSTSENTLAILLVPNPGETQSASTLADASMKTLEKASVQHTQPLANLPSTTTLNGETWAQRGVTGTVNENGQSFSGELILLVDNHPANAPSTQAYEISYAGLYMTFQQESVTFQAILQTFTFTS